MQVLDLVLPFIKMQKKMASGSMEIGLIMLEEYLVDLLQDSVLEFVQF